MWMAVKRGIIVVIGLILQILLSLSVYLFLGKYVPVIGAIYGIISILLVLAIIKRSKRLSSDLPWIIIIMLFPIVGALLYIIIASNLYRSKILKKINKNIEDGKKYLIQDKEIKQEIDDNTYNQLKYISNYAGFPVYNRTQVEYYSLGDIAYKKMLEELKKAKKFIFMEYFIIAKGQMWQGIYDILKEKAKEGLDVRLMYDDLGSIAHLDTKFPKELEKNGIKCISFNKLKPFAGVFMNNRDHRKMMIIDGHTVFSGGINIADEYINVTHPHGHWKDNGIMLKGEAVWNFTVMFLEIWNAYRNEDKDYTKYKYEFENKYQNNGYVVPYGQNPLEEEVVSENIYLNMINNAKKYVYIYTPYLIIDTNMINTLTLAAKRGVDVRIVVPGIPDKKIVYTLTSSYFEALVKGGVKIYTYTPGFVHSKVFISDDKYTTVGTINMDYRSLYLHFECGIFMQEVSCINIIKKDIEGAMNKSHMITEKEATAKGFKAIWQSILRIFAPLM